MAQIALKKPSGGELIITPEDGTSTETVTIPSVGVGKVINKQIYTLSPTGATQAISTNNETTIVCWDTVFYTKKDPNSTLYCTLQFHNYVNATQPSSFWIRGYNNGSIIQGNPFSQSYGQGIVMTHNTDQYTWKTSAHQHWSAHFVETSTVTNVALTFTHTHSGAGTIIYWAQGGDRLIIEEVSA